MEPKSKTYKLRGIVVFLLFIGFYVFAIGIACLFIFLVYLSYSSGIKIPGIVIGAMLIGTLVILWSIIPRPDAFEPPGPPITIEKNGDLRNELEEVSTKMKLELPQEIYFSGESNAWVAERGGVLGIGSRKVMSIGLPLLQILSIEELKSVLSHEYGHFAGGDTFLGSWIYKTYNSIARTIENLEKSNSLLRFAFIEYAKFFLKVAHAISRQQEFVADSRAVSTYGEKSFVSSLTKIHATAGAFESYWGQEVVPVLEAGFVPSISMGFREFVMSEFGKESSQLMFKESMGQVTVDPYDTHPTLSERLRNIKENNKDEHMIKFEFGESAIFLVPNICEIERALLVRVAGEEMVSSLQEIDWKQVPEEVMFLRWEKFTSKNYEKLRNLRFAAIPQLKTNLKDFTFGIKFDYPIQVFPEIDEWKATNLLGSAITTILKMQQWKITYAPGHEILMTKDQKSIRPFGILSEFFLNKITSDEFLRLLDDCGLTNHDFTLIEQNR